jgi:excisionase family DNA binding protein
VEPDRRTDAAGVDGGALMAVCKECGTPEMLTTAEAARYLGCSVKTLANLRSDQRGPAHFKLGRVLYARTDLDHWRNACRFVPTRR